MRAKPQVSPLLKGISPVSYMVACLQDQAGANGILKAFGLPEVPIYKDATVTPDMPQDIGSFSLRACQGHVGVPWTDMKMREDAPEGAILKAVVKVESKQRRMRGTGRPRNHKSYLEERPTQVQSLNHSTKRGN